MRSYSAPLSQSNHGSGREATYATLCSRDSASPNDEPCGDDVAHYVDHVDHNEQYQLGETHHDRLLDADRSPDEHSQSHTHNHLHYHHLVMKVEVEEEAVVVVADDNEDDNDGHRRDDHNQTQNSRLVVVRP